MHLELHGIEIAEVILLTAGGAALVTLACVVTVRQAWGRQLCLDAAPPNRLEPTDLLMGFVAVTLLPALGVAISSDFGGGADLAQTQEFAEAAPSTTTLALVAAGQIAGIAMLLGIGRGRFPGGLVGWGLSLRSWLRRLGTAVSIYVVLWPICFGLLHATVWLIQNFWPGFQFEEHSTIEMLLRAETPAASRCLLVVTAVVLAPAAEELFFRGLVLPILFVRFRSGWTAIFVGALAFGAMHYAVPHSVPALVVLGMVLGYVYLRSRSLTLAILVHMVFNAKSMIWLALGAVP